MKRLFLTTPLFLLSLLIASDAHSASRVFYDGFESGNSNLWAQADFRNMCGVVASAADGGNTKTGTYMARCNWNGTLEWNDPARFESLYKSGFSYSNEILWRAWIRRDNNLQGGSGPKIWRWNTNGNTFGSLYLDSATTGGTRHSIYNGAGNQIGGTYWGGDDAGDRQWHKLEFYVKIGVSDGIVRYWVDDVMWWEQTGADTTADWSTFYMSSNWSGADGCCNHDSANYLYWDEFEIYSDTGSGASGSMSDGAITVGGGDTTPPAAPTGLGVQ
ncbi:MAG: hypothetical protein WBP40_03180 [Candidatus Moraniibacteriota bacterium]